MADSENAGLRAKAERAGQFDPDKYGKKKGSSGSGSASLPAGSSEDNAATPSTFKRGGKVKKGGRAKVHKGEKILPKKAARKYSRGKGKR